MFWLVAGALALAALAVARIARDPRRPATGLVVVGAVFLAWMALASAAYEINPELSLFIGAGPLFVGVPLLVVAVGGALVVNGVVVMGKEGRRVANVVPVGVGLWLVGTVVGLVWWLAAAARLSVLVTALLLFVVFSSSWMILQLVAFTAYAWVYRRLDDHVRPDVIIVLGAGLAGDRVTPLLAGRLDRALEVQRRGQEAGSPPVAVVASGGRGPGESVAEGVAMGRYLVDHGLPPEVLVVEDRSTTTRENLVLSMEELARRDVEWQHLTVVTSDFHVLRAASLTRQLGVPANAVGARTAPYYFPTAFLREWVAVMVHQWRVHAAVLAGFAVLLALSSAPIGDLG